MDDTEVRVHTDQLQQSIFHGEHTANDCGAFRIDCHLPLKDLREMLIHTLGNPLMLSRT